MGDDHVNSYTGFRTISSGIVNGVQRPLLNGKFEFLFGTLDQGFWPDGLYTPPNKEAMVYDLKMLKGLGFNMLRKHVRIAGTLNLCKFTHYIFNRSKLSRIYFTAPVMNWACWLFRICPVCRQMGTDRLVQSNRPNFSDSLRF